MERKDWFSEASRRAALQIQISDELLLQKLELVEYYCFLKVAPADVKHEYTAIPEAEITAAAQSAVGRLRRGDYSFPMSRFATEREILIDWAARIRALDELVFDNADLAPMSPERWRVRTTATDVYLVPRWRPRPNPRRRDTGTLQHRGMIHHRMFPANVGEWEVAITPCRGRLSRTGVLRMGAGLFPGLKIVLADHAEIVADHIDCKDYSTLVSQHLRKAHDDECNVLLFPELTIDAAERQAIRSSLARRPWPSIWTTSLVLAGSWHDKIGETYFNVATAFSGYGDELATHRKILRYFENSSGRPEGISLGKKLTVLAFDDLIVAIGICRDFCERIEPDPNPLAELDADLFLVPSMGNKTTMKGHLETAREIERAYRSSSFVAQQSETERPVGYLIFPSNDLDRPAAAFETNVAWSIDTVDRQV